MSNQNDTNPSCPGDTETAFTLPTGYQRVDNWVYDSDNNRVSIHPWKNEQRAYEQLLTLTNCSGCSDCSRCSGCYDCSRCSGCYDCSRCSGCYDCSRCSRCSGCSDCSDCSRCSGCYDCSRCSGLKNASPVESQTVATIPVIENIHRTIYEAVTATPDALDMSTWHSNSCGTTHCYAGWVVHLAGEAGYALEARTSTSHAAMLICDASGYPISPVRFYESNEVALATMKRLAEGEASKANSEQ